MKISNCGYYIKEGMKSIVNNKVMSFASAATVAAALFVFGVFTLLVVNVDNLMSDVENKIEIQAFLNNGVTTIEEQNIKKTIEDIPNVKEIKYESKTDALKNYEKQLGENKDYAKGLEKDNPLPASFIVKVDKPESVVGVSSKI
ncbi:MAG TPA: ABC transporter permease, partial [Clostridiaceae bacterium]|nr:ABC transporter permease [Clostridiaceae bacterium]